MKKQKAFTLIELLVVVSIIGLLSSVVLISVKSAREKAEEKKAMQFSASIYHALGAYALAIWNFDGNFNDSSKNNVALSGGAGTVFTSGIINQSVYFDGGDYLTASSDKLTSQSGAITVEFWAYVENYSSTYMSLISQLDDTSGDVAYDCYIYSPQKRVSCFMANSDFDSTGFYTYIPNTKRWFHVVITYDGKNTGKMFFNNKEITPTSTYMTGKINNNGELEIGGDYDMRIDEVRIYDSYITISEVQKHYVEGLLKIGLAEYNKKYE